MVFVTAGPPVRGVQTSVPRLLNAKVSFTSATIVCSRGAPALSLPERLLNSLAVPWKA